MRSGIRYLHRPILALPQEMRFYTYFSDRPTPHFNQLIKLISSQTINHPARLIKQQFDLARIPMSGFS